MCKIHPSAAKALGRWRQSTARLKPCPFKTSGTSGFRAHPEHPVFLRKGFVGRSCRGFLVSSAAAERAGYRAPGEESKARHAKKENGNSGLEIGNRKQRIEKRGLEIADQKLGNRNQGKETGNREIQT